MLLGQAFLLKSWSGWLEGSESRDEAGAAMATESSEVKTKSAEVTFIVNVMSGVVGVACNLLNRVFE